MAWLSEKLGAPIIAGPGFDASRNCNGTRISGTESRVSVSLLGQVTPKLGIVSKTHCPVILLT